VNRRVLAWAGLAAVAAAVAAAVWRLTPDAPPRVEVAVPALSGEAAAGEPLFARYCASCHGAAGGGSETGPPLVHRIYAPGHHGDASFHYAALNGSRAHHWNFGEMPPVDGIAEEEVGKIVAFIRAVQRANGVE
jgi:mono/diheme cytochrome c family protein